jgi:hypothetical protein
MSVAVLLKDDKTNNKVPNFLEIALLSGQNRIIIAPTGARDVDLETL